MLLWQLQYLLPLLVGLGAVAWFGHGHAQSQQYLRYVVLVIPVWLAASAVYFLLGSVALKWQGQGPLHPTASTYIREFSAFGFAYLVPFVGLTALLLSVLGRSWSREAHVIWAFVVGAVAAFASPILLVVSACLLQDNCL